jgi:hypothetical protein
VVYSSVFVLVKDADCDEKDERQGATQRVYMPYRYWGWAHIDKVYLCLDFETCSILEK